MKKQIPIYVYNEEGVALHFDNIAKAADFTGDTPPTIAKRLCENKLSPRGYVYSKTELAPDELQKLFESNNKIQRANQICKETENGYEYSVDCDNRKVFFLERSKEDRKNQLKRFIYSRLQYHWMTAPKPQVALEKRFLKEIISSL